MTIRYGRSLMAGAAAVTAAGLAWQVAGAADTASARAQAPAPVQAPAREPYAPTLRDPLETNLYWGDLHLHSNQSADAYLNGTRAVSPDEAFRFAKGEAVDVLVHDERPDETAVRVVR